MASFNGEEFGAEVVSIIKGYLADQVGPLLKRVEELEAIVRALPTEPSPSVVELKLEISEEYTKAIDDVKAAIPDVSAIADAVIATLPDLSKMVQDAVDAIPRPVDGVDGKSVTVEEIVPLLREMVDELPKAKDGRDGVDGANGVGLCAAMLNQKGELVLTMTDGSLHTVGQVVGKKGDDGIDGVDGFSLDDFSLEQHGRTITMSFARGDVRKSSVLQFPVLLYRGIFDEKQEYSQGDTATYGGSLWHCDVVKTSAVPGRNNHDWSLCAKRGRDGRDLLPKEPKVATSVPVGGTR